MKRFVLFFSFLASLFFLKGCQSVKFFIVNAPTYFSRDIMVNKDISYGNFEWQKLDIYTPTNIKPNAPIVLFLYGGSWETGDKKDYAFVARYFSKKGYMVIIPDYVKYPTGRFPEFVNDIAVATKWIKTNIHQLNADAGNMHLVGHSAGAYIGGMLIADKSFLKQQKIEENAFRSFTGLSGPYDFYPEEEIYKKIFDFPKNKDAMRVPRFIDGTEPPMLLVHGLKDDIVNDSNIERLSKQLVLHNNEFEISYYKNASHVDTVAGFSGLVASSKIIAENVANFIEMHSKN